MYNKIHLKNVFVHKDLILDLRTGLTNISGLNGTGKTLIIEMAEFALWGVDALRGKLDGYKGASVQLWFTVKGKDYSVYRTTSKALLSDSQGKELATGTKPVNAKIAELFGYGYNVFQIANSAKQNQILALGEMKPTARKQLVDETIGLNKIEALGKWASERATEANTEVRVMERDLRKPEPLPAAPREVLSEHVKELQDMAYTLSTYRTHLVPVVEVTPHPNASKLQELREQQQARVQAIAEIRGIDMALKGFPTLGVAPTLHERDSDLEELLTETALHTQAVSEVQTLGRALEPVDKDPLYTAEELDQAEANIAMHVRWVAKQKLLGAQVKHSCPNCNFHWFDDDLRLNDYLDVPDAEPQGLLTKQAITVYRNILGQQELRKTLKAGFTAARQKLEDSEDHTALIEAIRTARRAVERYQDQVEADKKRVDLIAKREAIVTPDDVSELIREIEQASSKYATYLMMKDQYDTAVEKTKGIPENIHELLEAMTIAREDWIRWQSAKQNFDKATATYEAQLETLESLKQKAQDWASVKEAIATLRARIKGYLLPSLNAVASQLVSLMSNQWLNKVEVTEDFEIETDGRPLETLSGAGKTLTNLALRIGLGQVLTNSVFSSLVLDEADASVDVEKAPMIAAGLRALSKSIKQVIVISHKQGLEADHYVRF